MTDTPRNDGQSMDDAPGMAGGSDAGAAEAAPSDASESGVVDADDAAEPGIADAAAPGIAGSDATGGADAVAAAEPGSRRRWPWMAGIAAVLIVGGGALAFSFILGGGGPQPAEALPASTDVYFRVDLDPSPGQKIAAVRLAGRFPALEDVADELEDDLKAAFFEFVGEQDPDFAAEFDYETDIAPWLGDRIGVGVILDDPDRPVPLVAIQVSDRDAAAETLPRLLRPDASGGVAGFAFTGEYVLIAEEQALADRYAAEAEVASLADSERFTELHDMLGDPGVMSFWFDGDLDQLIGGDLTAQGGVNAAPASRPADALAATEPEPGRIAVAAAIRLDDRHLELAGVTLPDPGTLPDDIPGSMGSDLDAATALGRLPVTTLFGLFFGGIDLDPEQRTQLWNDMMQAPAEQGFDPDQLADDLEAETGVSLPDDLFDLLSNDITLAIDASVLRLVGDFGSGSTGFPIAIVFDTDESAGREAVTKLVDLIEDTGFGLWVDDDGSTIVLSASNDYLSAITGEDTQLLAESGVVDRVVDSGQPVWLATFFNVQSLVPELRPGGAMAGSVEDDVLENLEVLEAVGFTAWADTTNEDLPVGHFRFRVSVGEEG